MSEEIRLDKQKILGLTRRQFVIGSAALGAAAAFTTYKLKTRGSAARARVVVIGGGCAGMSVTVRLRRLLKNAEITLVDSATRQYYQPGFTLIGGGIYQPDQVWREQADFVPKGVKWVQEAVIAVDPTQQSVTTDGGTKLAYDFLVLTPGIELKWHHIEGFTYAELGQAQAHTIYDFKGSQMTWSAIQEFVKKGGRGIYTDTYTKHKCGGAPKKICLLTEHLARKQNRRKSLTFDFFTASSQLYDVPHFTPRLLDIYKERNVSISTKTRLTGIDLAAKKVYLEQRHQAAQADGQTGATQEVVSQLVQEYDFLHFTPPQGPPEFVREAGLNIPSGSLAREGWIEVDKETLIHPRYANIITLGDASGLPTSKTSAAARKQIPVAVNNLVALIDGRTPEAKYDGYAACPIITDYGHVILAEFNYEKKAQISFPFSLLNMAKEQRAAWLLKVYALKPLYFHGMLRGIW